MPRKGRHARKVRGEDSDDDAGPSSVLLDLESSLEDSGRRRRGRCLHASSAASQSTVTQQSTLETSRPTPEIEDPPAASQVFVSYTVARTDCGMRIDRLLAVRLPGLPTRGRVKRALKDGGVLLNGAVVARPTTAVRPGDVLRFRDAHRAAPGLVCAEPIPLHVYHEDDHCIVLEKPAGMAVHPAGGLRSGTLVNALLHHVRCPQLEMEISEEHSDEGSEDEASSSDSEPCRENAMAGDVGAGQNLAGLETADLGAEVVRPGIVHRLDRGTSGVMVAAKTDAAHAALSRQFGLRQTRRTYLAVVWGVPHPPVGRIEAPIGRDPGDRLRMAVTAPGKGKPAATNYEVLRPLDGGHLAWVQFRLETGRTHQIRVHARHLGHPLLGDAVYNGAQIVHGPATPQRKQLFDRVFAALPRPALHAATLGFRHPHTGRWLAVSSPVPTDLLAVAALLGDDGPPPLPTEAGTTTSAPAPSRRTPEQGR